MGESKTIRPGESVTVVLSRTKGKKGGGPPDFRGSEPPDLDARPAPRPELALYHANTFFDFNLTTGLNTYTQIRLETSVGFSHTDVANARAALLGALERRTTLGGARPIWSTAPAQAGSYNTDGLLAGAIYRSELGNEVRQEFISETAAWSRRVPYTQRLADIDAQIAADETAIAAGTREPGRYQQDLLEARGRVLLEALESWTYEGQFYAGAREPGRYQQDLLEARGRVLLEALESWTYEGQFYAGGDGSLRTPLLDGIHTLGIDSTHHLQPWSAWDTTNYRVTSEPYPLADRVDPPVARVGSAQHTRHEVIAAPQFLQYLVRWEALYIIGTVFFFSEVAIPQVGVFADALPLLPEPYRLAGPTQNAQNSKAVSRYVESTRTYERMINADHALEIYTPFFFIILIGRIGGEVNLFRLNQPIRRLCAVVKQYENGGAALTRYIWGETVLERVNSIIDALPLATALVVPADVLFVDR